MILHDKASSKEMSLHLSMLWSLKLFLLGGETVCTTGPLTMFACYEDERQLWMLWGYYNASVVLCVMGSWRKQMYFAASQSFNIDLSRMDLDMYLLTDTCCSSSHAAGSPLSFLVLSGQIEGWCLVRDEACERVHCVLLLNTEKIGVNMRFIIVVILQFTFCLVQITLTTSG